MKIETSYNIQIWVGLKSRYDGPIHTIEEVRQICKDWTDEIPDCVTITPTEFHYVDGWEPGIIVGYIKYPRFPISDRDLTRRALKLAERLRVGLNQIRVSVSTPERTYLLEENEKS